MKRTIWWKLLLFLMVLGAFKIVHAQCGASLSSCKSCHEVKREMPVMNKGDWHQDHSFGDFCEFCHGGNTASTNKTEAHTDMALLPVKNPGNSCSSCHPDDYKGLAQQYASVLKVDIQEDNEAPVADVQSQQTNETGTSQNEPQSGEIEEPMAASTTSISIPSGGEVVDFEQIFNESESGEGADVGNIILFGLIGGLGVLWVGMFWSFNGDVLKQRFHTIASQPPVEEEENFTEQTQLNQDEILNVLNDRPQLRQLMNQLKDTDPAVLAALISITGQNGESEKLIKAIGKLDLNLMKSLQTLKDSELEVLFTLAKKM